ELTCKGTLRFFETGASLQTENLWVKCDLCGSARSLAQAFGREAKNNLPACRGRHPHLDEYDACCDEAARTVLLGATNSLLPSTSSVLPIPQIADSLRQLIADGWDDFKDLESSAELKGLLKSFIKRGVLPGIERFSADDIWAVIEKKRAGSDSPTGAVTDI